MADAPGEECLCGRRPNAPREPGTDIAALNSRLHVYLLLIVNKMYGLFTVLVKCIPDQALKNILEKMLCVRGVSQELNDMRIKYINGLRRSGIKYGEREFLDRAFPASCISWIEKCSGCKVILAEGEQPLDGDLWGHLDSTDRTGWDKISVCTKCGPSARSRKFFSLGHINVINLVAPLDDEKHWSLGKFESKFPRVKQFGNDLRFRRLCFVVSFETQDEEEGEARHSVVLVDKTENGYSMIDDKQSTKFLTEANMLDAEKKIFEKVVYVYKAKETRIHADQLIAASAPLVQEGHQASGVQTRSMMRRNKKQRRH